MLPSNGSALCVCVRSAPARSSSSCFIIPGVIPPSPTCSPLENNRTSSLCVCVSIRPVCWRAAWLSSEEGPAVWGYGLPSPGSDPLRPSPRACSSSWPSPCYNHQSQSIFAGTQEKYDSDLWSVCDVNSLESKLLVRVLNRETLNSLLSGVSSSESPSRRVSGPASDISPSVWPLQTVTRHSAFLENPANTHTFNHQFRLFVLTVMQSNLFFILLDIRYCLYHLFK